MVTEINKTTIHEITYFEGQNFNCHLKNDEIIWKSFVEGSSSAFDDLMNHHFEPLYQYGIKLCEDSDLVKDCIQDFFINLWKRKDSLDMPVNMKAYFFASLRRAIFRKLKSLGKTGSNNIFYESWQFSFQISVEDEYILNEQNRQLASEIAACIQNLPARQKEIIYLKYFQDLSREQISDMLGISPQTISNLMQMAFKKLRYSIKTGENISLLLFFLASLFKK